MRSCKKKKKKKKAKLRPASPRPIFLLFPVRPVRRCAPITTSQEGERVEDMGIGRRRERKKTHDPIKTIVHKDNTRGKKRKKIGATDPPSLTADAQTCRHEEQRAKSKSKKEKSKERAPMHFFSTRQKSKYKSEGEGERKRKKTREPDLPSRPLRYPRSVFLHCREKRENKSDCCRLFP